MKNKVLLSTLPFEHVSSVLPPMGLLYIAAVLEEKGFEAKILDANLYKLSKEKILEAVEEFNPSIVGFSVPTAQLGSAGKAAELLNLSFPTYGADSGIPVNKGVIKAKDDALLVMGWESIDTRRSGKAILQQLPMPFDYVVVGGTGLDPVIE